MSIINRGISAPIVNTDSYIFEGNFQIPEITMRLLKQKPHWKHKLLKK
jgi:hypothetical protein